MTPVKVQVYESRGMKNAIYQVGETNLEFTEPWMPTPPWAIFGREGPGVYHIAFASTGSQRWQGLAAQGHTLREPGGTGRSAEGYLTATLDRQALWDFPSKWRKVVRGRVGRGSEAGARGGGTEASWP